MSCISRIRYSGDKIEALEFPHINSSTQLLNSFLSNELAITKDVTPDLHKCIENVLNRLRLDNSFVNAFVYPSSELNAQSFVSDQQNCIIRFSSSLIQILSLEEFEFVIGHEIGHFLFSHGAMANQEPGFEQMIYQRAKEISADRVGLVACSSLNSAIKALLKTASGLGDAYLRFDVGAFLSQLRKVGGVDVGASYQTHPSILVRCRALLWFSMSKSFTKGYDYFDEQEISEVDKKIRKDMDKYVDNHAREVLREQQTDQLMWKKIKEIVDSGGFSKEMQKTFEREFGSDLLNKVIDFMNSLTISELKKELEKRLHA